MNFNILGFLFQKNEYFLGYEDFMDILGVITKGVISMHFRVVSKGQCTELGIFFGFVKFHFFGGWGWGGVGFLIFLIILESKQ